MHPGRPPSFLPLLSAIEESLIALHCPILKVIRLKGGSLGYTGNCVAVTQDIQSFVTKLPRLICETNITIVMPSVDLNGEAPKSLHISNLKVKLWLRFLITSNPLYEGIVLDEVSLLSLPELGTTFAILSSLICIAPDDAASDMPDAPDAATDIVFQGIMGDNTKISEEAQIEQLVWPERSATAIREYNHPNILAKCFPTVFPFGIGDPTSPSRPKAVTLAEGINHLQKYSYYSETLARIVWPFGEHYVAPFYSFDIKARQILLGQSGIFMKHAGDFPTTIQELRQSLQDPASKNKLLKQMGKYAGNLPGTPGFWQSRKDELLSLCEQSPPQIWFTLSAADMFWWDLRNILPAGSKAHTFPHLVDGYVAMKMDAYVKAIWGSRAEWTWYRLEYQSRGTVHLHGCVRLRNIPDLNALYAIAQRGRLSPESASFVDAGIAAEQQICNIADMLCSAWNPSPPHDAVLDDRDERGERPEPHPCSICFDDADLERSRVNNTLNEVQRHRHVASYCLRKGKCRFGYPLPLTNETHLIWTPCTSSGIKGTLMYRRNDRWLNNYNSGFNAWNANMDVKIIYNLHCLAEYLCGYATKSESTSPSVARTLALAVIHPMLDSAIDPVKSAIRSAFIKGHSGRNISAQETAHLNLSLPLVSQPGIEYVRLSIDDSSSAHQLDLSAADSIIVPTLLDLYRARLNFEMWSEDLCEWCQSEDCLRMPLIEFATKFYYCKHIGKIRARALSNVQRIVIPHPKIRANPVSKLYSKYCLHKLILHHPWNNAHNWDETNSVERWESHSATTGLGQFDNELLNFEADETSPAFSQEEEQADFSHWNQVMNSRENSLNFGNVVWSQMLSYDGQIATALDKARKNASPNVQPDIETTVVLDGHQQQIVETFCRPLSGLCVMIGSGGYGKSEVCLSIKRKLGAAVAVTAMTGKAGSLISGTTLHAFAHLPIKNQHKCALSSSMLGNFQKSLQGITHLIVDEFTMMSQEVLYFLDVRLREGMSSTLPFGGMNIILVGDTAQLPPVQGLSLWARPPKSTAIETIGAALYAMFTTAFTLKINYRQRSAAGAPLATFLEGMRSGKLSAADSDFLLSRSREVVGETAWETAVATAIHLYPTNEKVDEHNTAKLHALSTTGVAIAMIRSINSCPGAAKASKKVAGGLDNLFAVGVGASVMLTQNLWIKHGLVNGSSGTVVDLVGTEGVCDCIIVDVPKYTGPALCAPHPATWIPISRSSASWFSGGRNRERKQFPLTLAYALTIHKSQGSTFSAGTDLVIDIGSRDQAAGLTYVAFSRHSVGINIFHPGYPNSRLEQNFLAPSFKQRMREEVRLRSLECL
jgi:ATP-dependent DNA helicase PIF1